MTKISDLQTDQNNANLGTQRGLKLLDQSLRELGAGRSILVDREGRVIAGNKTLEAAADIGIEDVILVPSDGTKLVAVQRTDLDLRDDERARRLAYYDNRVAELDLDWNIEQLLADAEALPDGLWSDEEMAALLQSVPIGDTDTDRDGQTVGSAWRQVSPSQMGLIIIEELQIRLPENVVEFVKQFLIGRFENRREPIHETMKTVLIQGIEAYEISNP